MLNYFCYLVLNGGILGSGLFGNKTPDLVNIDDRAEIRVSLVMEGSHTEFTIVACKDQKKFLKN